MSDKEVYEKIQKLAEKYSSGLKKVMASRVEEMKDDDNSHYLVYRVLGITDKEGALIDAYQNKGRFLYKYAGSFLEEVTILCFENKFPDAKRKLRIKNTLGKRPKTFEIDCLVKKEAFEIKWKDATTDGDHITKEHTRLKNIKKAGYIPIRIMYYYPNRGQAIRIQDTLQTLYKGAKGKYFYGDMAWSYVKKTTGIDLLGIMEKIAKEKTAGVE